MRRAGFVPGSALSFSSWKQQLWHELHTRAADPRTDLAREAAWLRSFAERIPCDGCRHHWRTLCRQHPPDLASRYRYFRWGVRMHNAVSDIVGNPRLTFAAARAEWGFDSPAQTHGQPHPRLSPLRP